MLSPNEKLAKFWNVKLASENEAIKRIQTCRACDQFISLTSMCKQCGCYMPFKTKLRSMGCPIGHWSPEEDEPVNNGSSGDEHGNQLRSPKEHDK